jgi:hypothetical protein|nr:hypothetical protein [uncultured Mediterranean phage uvMED]
MNVSIFRRQLQWVVLTDSLEITLHQSLASAMSHATAQIRSPDSLGTAEPSHTACYDC